MVRMVVICRLRARSVGRGRAGQGRTQPSSDLLLKLNFFTYRVLRNLFMLRLFLHLDKQKLEILKNTVRTTTLSILMFIDPSAIDNYMLLSVTEYK